MWPDKQHNMSCVDDDELLESKELRKYPQPLSLGWRFRHGSAYLLGNFLLAGIMFVVGGAAFLYADLSEWWLNNRIGCFYYEYYRDDYEKQVMNIYEREDSFYGKYQRVENGVNYSLSVFGSFLYFVGGFFYIPGQSSVIGTKIFIYGSAVIVISQLWKLYRWGCLDRSNLKETKFRLKNLLYDTPGTLIDFWAGIGGMFYLIGSVYFLPEYDVSDYYTNLAAILFVCGGLSFTFSGIFMQYRYYLAYPPKYPN